MIIKLVFADIEFSQNKRNLNLKIITITNEIDDDAWKSLLYSLVITRESSFRNTELKNIALTSTYAQE